jgi:3-deoxy-D-manno-octulosonate 8-phosphate phosphatase (KDO 8-P phosphatase)
MRDLRKVAKDFESKLKKIKVALFDCDGILTSGHIYYHDDNIGFNRSFHVQDGYGLKILKQGGIKVGIISGGDSYGLKKRADYLNLDFTYLGKEDKREALRDVLDTLKVDVSEVLYMGDELFDLPLLKVCGFSATVPESSYEVQEACHYVTERPAGNGCVREVVDILRYAQGIYPDIKNF